MPAFPHPPARIAVVNNRSYDPREDIEWLISGKEEYMKYALEEQENRRRLAEHMHV